MWVALILLIISSAWLIFTRLRRKRQFWKRLGVKQCDNPNVLFGDHPMSNTAVVLGKTSVYEGSLDLYNKFKGNKYFGVYGFPSSPPILVVKDLHLLNHILGESARYIPSMVLLKPKIPVSDFDHFIDKTYMGYDMGRGTSYNDEIWKKQMFSLKGEEWKSVRGAVTPIFTPLKLKKMVPVVNKVAKDLEGRVASLIRRDKLLDPMLLGAKFSTDTTARGPIQLREIWHQFWLETPLPIPF